MTMTTHSSRNRSLASAFALLAVAIAAACSYTAQKGDIALHVDGLPASAVRAEVLLTTSSGDSKTYSPRFAVHDGTLDLGFAAPSNGTYTVTIRVAAFDAADNFVADGTIATATAVLVPAADGTPVPINLTVATVAAEGTYAARCKTDDGGTQSCSSGLICVQYQGTTSRGVCTQACTGVCPSAPTPLATCSTNGSGQACQWECGAADGGSAIGPCPPGLVCLTQVNSSKKFCQPPQAP